MSRIELRSLLSGLEEDLRDWRSDRQGFQGERLDTNPEYAEIQKVIADHEHAINALRVFLNQKVEGEERLH